MKLMVRSGRIEEVEIIASRDPGVQRRILEWKLNNGEIIVAENHTGVVGYLRLEYLWSKYPYIGLIKVDNELRNQGIGRALLGFAEEEFRGKGIDVLYSSSQVNEAEPQEWHRRMGFQECGIINGINEGGIGEVFFAKRLL
ncbi:GNAT family N-acetyltransferase [Paenibacillus lutrae]|uniref:GNAT family N-acetyltransferase n=1 Tax=Paenibacillus lutrae TaxID=2078573 RepID=A0A7X3FK30_9BACL|nr:GNAT family N-acetyltransferase [Paenibacillus lutrae]MVP01199.1 GNAT family N-acetyltransferase [Paenibacillus lutrae]